MVVFVCRSIAGVRFSFVPFVLSESGVFDSSSCFVLLVMASSSYCGVLKRSFVRIRDVWAVRVVEVPLSVNVFGVSRIAAECC